MPPPRNTLSCAVATAVRRYAITLAALAATAAACLGQLPRQALAESTACLGDTVRLEGSPYYITYDWKPDQFGRRDGRQFYFVADRDRDIILRSEPPLGPNLIANNNFSDGLAGYATDYTVVTPSTGKPGEMAVLADLRNFDATWRDCPDVTRDGGPDRMLVLRGSGDDTRAITRNRVTLERDSFYVITFLATTTGVGNTPEGGELGVRVDGVTLAASLRLPNFNCSWRQFHTVYRAPRSGEYDIAIVDKSRRPGFGYAIDGTLTAKLEPARVDTFRVRIIAADTAFAQTRDLCPGEVFTGAYFTARADSTVCTRIPRAGRCDSLFCESVTFLAPPQITVLQEGPSCAGGTDGRIDVRLPEPSAGFRVAWADGAEGATRAGLAGGTYVATITTPSGCTERRSFVLETPERLAWTTVAFAPEDCPGAGPQSLDVATQGGTGAVVLGFRQNLLEVAREGLRPGRAELSAVDTRGCRIDTAIQVPRDGDLLALAIRESSGSGGAKVLSWTGGPAAAASTTWTLDGVTVGTDTSIVLGARTTGALGLTLVTASGCVWPSTRTLSSGGTEPEYFPTAFSPNRDDVNDTFWIVERTDVVAVERFEIYDRWGGLVFRRVGCAIAGGTTTGVANDCAWRGRSDDGQELELDPGVYVYSAQLRLSDDSLVHTGGAVSLLR